MKYIKFILLGMLFGIVATKSEIISWYRIQEMFHFQSFHMYGVIGSAVVVGMIGVALMKRFGAKDIQGEVIHFNPKDFTVPRYLLGGIIFGLGWGLTGACPGPMFALLGNGILVMLVVIAFSLLGTLTYGMVRDKLPH
jgi:uncharacterized membrane protein YedE/YeeE